MSETTIGIRIIHSAKEHSMMLPTQHIPPRSRLYGLAPCESDTMWCESLTSYLNRLGWTHGVSPCRLVAQELLPALSLPWLNASPNKVAAFSRGSGAMHLNGTQTLAAEASTCLERLTMQSDLHLLTLRWWIGDLPLQRNLRLDPAWCPRCYAEWKAQNAALYQPLLWMLQVVTWCPRHTSPLIDRCPHCDKAQSMIFKDDGHIGECTQCSGWLGANGSESMPRETPEGGSDWQTWVMFALEELRLASHWSGVFHWETFFTQLALNMKRPGATHLRLAQFTGIKRGSLYRWTDHEITPTLEMLLYFCYRCRVTPVQIMAGPSDTLQQALQQETTTPSHSRPKVYQQLDKQRCLEFLRSMLDGKESIRSLSETAKHLGCSDTLLKSHFPQECALIVQKAQEYRGQRKEQRVKQLCDEIQRAVAALHLQGISPSSSQVTKFLSKPFALHSLEARASWHAARRKLGLEQ